MEEVQAAVAEDQLHLLYQKNQQAEEAEASSITLHIQESQEAVAEDLEAALAALQAEDQEILQVNPHHKVQMVDQAQAQTETDLEAAEAERLTPDNLHLTTELQDKAEAESQHQSQDHLQLMAVVEAEDLMVLLHQVDLVAVEARTDLAAQTKAEAEVEVPLDTNHLEDQAVVE